MERGLELVCLILMRLRECQSRGTVSLRHSLLGQEVSGAELRGAGRHWGEISGAELRGPVRHWGKIPGAERRGAGGDQLSHVETKIYSTRNYPRPRGINIMIPSPIRIY